MGFPGNFVILSGKFPVMFGYVREMVGNVKYFPGRFQTMSRNVRDISWNFPGHVRDISGICPGNFREMSRTCPGNVQDTSGKKKSFQRKQT